MQREIKFRAWDKEHQEMVDSIPTGTVNFYGSLNNFLKNTELMQYTGLNDKNGKEIYEGDIVKTDVNGKLWEVAEYDYSWVFMNENVKDKDKLPETYYFREYLRRLRQANASIEIIGNIYENTELLSSNTKENHE